MTDQRLSVSTLETMRRLASIEEMRAMERHAIEVLGLPGRLLMENAAAGLASRASALLGHHRSGRRVVVICGWGNNGGDGFAAARLLADRGHRASVVWMPGDAGAGGRSGGGDPSGAVDNREAWRQLGPCFQWPGDRREAEEALSQAELLVDALFGTGLGRAVTGDAASLIEAINTIGRNNGVPVVAADIPSGIHGDTGQVMGVAVRCTHTVSFQAGKPGCYLHPGSDHAGEVEVIPISIPQSWPPDHPGTYLLTRAFAAAALPVRPSGGHKGTFGHLLAVCGSAGMGGAALMAGRSALKTGTGLVTLAVPSPLRDQFLAAAPELMTLAPSTAPRSGPADSPQVGPADSPRSGPADSPRAGYFTGEDLPGVLAAAASRSAVVVGCGLGRAEATVSFVRRLVAEVRVPLLIDADGLFALEPVHLKAGREGRPGHASVVITPHLGELSRLAGIPAAELAAGKIEWARRLAAEWGVILVMKGPGTVIAAPEGDAFINPTGDHGLASGGTGDVLSGIIGGLLAQGCEPLQAALLGVYLHGLARDCQRERFNPRYFTATELMEGINLALLELEGQGT